MMIRGTRVRLKGRRWTGRIETINFMDKTAYVRFEYPTNYATVPLSNLDPVHFGTTEVPSCDAVSKIKAEEFVSVRNPDGSTVWSGFVGRNDGVFEQLVANPYPIRPIETYVYDSGLCDDRFTYEDMKFPVMGHVIYLCERWICNNDAN